MNATLLPDHLVSFFKWGMMAPDGRCKTFDAAADGFVRAEGCGIVVLKRLSDAVKDGDNVLAVIRGSAVNQDGASSGLTVPNGPAQEAVIRQALRIAGVAPSEVGYVEAHGTGTTLGDPIELEALDAVLGEGRPAGRPLIVGSVKTNLGHMESSAAVAGVIKTVLALQNEEIPPHLHFHRLSPRITVGKCEVVIPTARTPWRMRCGFNERTSRIDGGPAVSPACGTMPRPPARAISNAFRYGSTEYPASGPPTPSPTTPRSR